MPRPRYDTHAGLPTRGLLIAQMLERMRLQQEDCAMFAHLLNTENNDGDKLLAKGWLGMAELFKRIEYQLIQLAKGGLQ